MFGGSPDSTGFLDIQWATLVVPTIEKWYWYCIQWATLVLVLILHPMGNHRVGIGIASNGHPWFCKQLREFPSKMDQKRTKLKQKQTIQYTSIYRKTTSGL